MVVDTLGIKEGVVVGTVLRINVEAVVGRVLGIIAGKVVGTVMGEVELIFDKLKVGASVGEAVMPVLGFDDNVVDGRKVLVMEGVLEWTVVSSVGNADDNEVNENEGKDEVNKLGIHE